MRGLLYTALVVAAAGICANAEIKLNLTRVSFPTERKHRLCLASCNFAHGDQWYESNGAYHELNHDMNSKDLYEKFCPKMYGHHKCMSNCLEAFNIANATKAEAVTTPETVTKKICTGLTEKLSTLDTLTECANKIYPLIAKPEENAKCRKMCCSYTTSEAPLYACNDRITLTMNDAIYLTPDGKENMCQLACVIDQAAKLAHTECSSVLAETLLIARQDVQAIYQLLEKKMEDMERRQIEAANRYQEMWRLQMESFYNAFFHRTTTVDTTTTVQPTEEVVELEHHDMDTYYKTEDSDF